MFIRVWGVGFICINIYSNYKHLCVDSCRVIMYWPAHVLYVFVFLICCYSLHISMHLSMYPWIYLCFLMYLIHLYNYVMYMFILPVYGYELICVCPPVYSLIFRSTLPRDVIQFIALELIWISTSLSCSSFHNTLFILYPV